MNPRTHDSEPSPPAKTENLKSVTLGLGFRDLGFRGLGFRLEVCGLEVCDPDPEGFLS